MSSIDRILSRFTAAIAAALVLGACSGDSGGGTGPRPVAGTAVVTLVGVKADDAGVVLEVAEPVTALTPGAGVTVNAGQQTADGHRRLLVLGDLSGALVRLGVADIGKLPQVQVREVAARDGTPRADLSGYSAEVRVQ